MPSCRRIAGGAWSMAWKGCRLVIDLVDVGGFLVGSVWVWCAIG